MKLLERAFDFIITLSLSLALGVAPALSQAALLPNAKQTFLDNNGNPLTGGKVFSYVPNTTTPKTTWSNPDQTTPNANPVTLDAAGRAIIYGQGSYQQRVLDKDGNLIWSAPSTAYGSSEPSGANGTDTAPVGAIMAFSGLVAPTNWQFASGQELDRDDFPQLFDEITIRDETVSCVSASSSLSGWDDTSQMRIGAPIEASCLPTGTVITSITSSTQITVDHAATATTVVAARVFPWGDGNGVNTYNVPDLRGRVPAAPDAMGGTAARRLSAATTITTESGNVFATVASPTGLFAGMSVASANVPAGTTITRITGSVVLLSNAASATASGTAATFYAFPQLAGVGVAGGAASQTLQQSELSQNLGTTSLSDPGHSHSVAASSEIGNSTDPSTRFPAVIVGGGTNSYRNTTNTSMNGAMIGSSSTGIGVSLTNNLQVITTIDTVNASNSATVTSAAGLFVGMTIVCSQSPFNCSIPNGTTITAISGTTITMSANATATQNNRNVNFQYAAGGNAHSTLQPTVLINYIIKVKPNSSGAGGVVSIGGMFGDILCGLGLDCSNGVISAAGTPSLPEAQIYVGDVDNLPVARAMTGDCTLSSLGVITCTGSSPVTTVLTADVLPVSSTLSIVIIDKAAPAPTVITLPPVATRSGTPLEIIDFAGNAGDITITPDGTETIMGLGSWIVASSGGAGAGGSIKLIPNTTINGWAVQ